LELHQKKLGVTAIAKRMGIGRSTVYKLLQECALLRKKDE